MGCSLVPSRMTHGGCLALSLLMRVRMSVFVGYGHRRVVAKRTRTYPCEWLGGFWLAQTGAEQGHAGWETSGSWRLPATIPRLSGV